MREKWNTSRANEVVNGQPIQVSQSHQFVYEPTYKPKLLLKSPSMRAMRNYHNLSIRENSPNSYENLNFIPESGNVDLNSYDEASISNESRNEFSNNYDLYDYSASLRTNKSFTASDVGSERNEMGSTTKLVSPKMGKSCQTWFTHLETILCTISLAAGFGNLYRLPQMTLLQGGLPFLVAYVILVILVGLPLLFLELGIGQLAQEGFIKSWRAIPFFKGVGFVKLIAGCLLGIYYPLYMGLSLYYIIWIPSHRVPFKECLTPVRMTVNGYSTKGLNGQQCLNKTFLESPIDGDATWYGIFAGILFVIWTMVLILSIHRTKSFTRSLSILLFPVLACTIALIVKAVDVAQEVEISPETDFSVLKNSYIWYYAAIQVFYSTNVGFGTFITSAGLIYNKVNPKWTALGYIGLNLLFGIGAVVLCYIFSHELSDLSLREGEVPELHLVALIYTILVNSDDREETMAWVIVAFAAILLAGFISMATITYTLLKAITVQTRRRLKWWQASIVLTFIGFILGCAVLLQSDFQIVRLLDHYIVGNLIIVSVIIEVCALIAFYGTERIKSDFEFMMGHILAKIWLILWWLLPLLLTAIFAWALITFPKTIFTGDPEWLYITGWSVVLLAVIFIFIAGIVTVVKQDGYTFGDKLKASLKPSSKWGPKDPMLRHTWLQWNTKAKQGERDFTLKRRGTNDYTRSVKRNAKKANLEKSPAVTLKNDQNQNVRISNGSVEYAEPYYNRPLRVTSLVDSLEPPQGNRSLGGYRRNINPLARPHTYDGPDGSNSEGYGTFRKGPYVIPDSENVTHVCYRKYSQEDATEL